MKYNLIKFSNGKYGVRRNNDKTGLHEFYDLIADFWWNDYERGGSYMPENEARIILEELRNPNSPPTYEVIE